MLFNIKDKDRWISIFIRLTEEYSSDCDTCTSCDKYFTDKIYAFK